MDVHDRLTGSRQVRSRPRLGRCLGAFALATSAVAVVATGDTSVVHAAGPARHSDFNGDGFDDLVIGVPFDMQDSGQRGGSVQVLYGGVPGLSATGSQLLNQDTAGIDGVSESGDVFGEAIATGDFDGDGFDDLAVGAPGENFSTAGDGVVHVIYGSAAGLSPTRSQLWSRDSPGVPGIAEAHEAFGSALAAGNLGRGGNEDLAIASPGAVASSGVITVLFGGRGGLSSSGAQDWHAWTPGLAGGLIEQVHLGETLAIGDFDGNGIGDLAASVQHMLYDGPYARDGGGAVHVLYGTTTGLSLTGHQIWWQGSAGILGEQQPGEYFGHAMVTGDLNGSGQDELLVSAPYKSESGGGFTGVVYVIHGSPTGLVGQGSQRWSVASPGILGEYGTQDDFGFALAIGDFGGSSSLDLAVGAPEENVDGAYQAGDVHVIYGSASGLTSAGNQIWTQNSKGILDEAEDPGFYPWGEHFGSALVAGNYGSGAQFDLAIGVPWEDLARASTDEHGLVHMILGSPTGLTSTGNQQWTQDSPGLAGSAQTDDTFGRTLG